MSVSGKYARAVFAARPLDRGRAVLARGAVAGSDSCVCSGPRSSCRAKVKDDVTLTDAVA